jgi:hypothetical protein
MYTEIFVAQITLPPRIQTFHIYDMIYLLTAIGFCHPVAVHIYTQTIHRTTQITTEQHKYKVMWKSAGRAPSLRVFTPGICLLQLRKKHGKNLGSRKSKTKILTKKNQRKCRFRIYRNVQNVHARNEHDVRLIKK